MKTQLKLPNKSNILLLLCSSRLRNDRDQIMFFNLLIMCWSPMKIKNGALPLTYSSGKVLLGKGSVTEQRWHPRVSTCGCSREGGDWLQGHAQMERSPRPADRKPKGHLQRRPIVWLCIILFNVPHEFTARLKLAGPMEESIICEGDKGVLVKCVSLADVNAVCAWRDENNRCGFQLNTLLNYQQSKYHRHHHEKGKQNMKNETVTFVFLQVSPINSIQL